MFGTTTIIHRNSNEQLTPNFRELEFFTKCPDFKGQNHILDARLITAVQAVRNFMNVPVYITSTFRTKQCNAECGGSPGSWHLNGMALDFTTASCNSLIIDDIKNCGKLFVLLHSCGIKGFGLYPGHIHIDTRPKGSQSHGKYKFSMWSLN